MPLEALGAAASLGGGLVDAWSTMNTNKANVALAREQMQFQAMMSSTAHQREVADLKAAGLNPILSATGGSGASSPAGSSATMVAPQIGSSAKSAADTYAQYAALNENLKNVAADTEQKIASSKLLASQNESTAKDIERKGIDNSFQGALLGTQLKKMGIDADLAVKSFGDQLKQIAANVEATKAGVKGREADTAFREQETKYGHLSDKLLEGLGFNASSAKDHDRSFKDNLYDLHSIFMRKFFGGK